MRDPIASSRYTEALFLEAENIGETDKVMTDLKDLRSMAGKTGLMRFLGDPQHRSEKKERVIASLRRGLSSRLTADFLTLLLRKNRLHVFENATDIFQDLWDRKRDRIEGRVWLAHEPSVFLQKRIEAYLRQATRKDVRIRYIVQADLIGGMVIKVGNHALDASVPSLIKKFETKLLETQLN